MCKIRTLVCDDRKEGLGAGKADLIAEAAWGHSHSVAGSSPQGRCQHGAEMKAAGAFATLGHGTYSPAENTLALHLLRKLIESIQATQVALDFLYHGLTLKRAVLHRGCQYEQGKRLDVHNLCQPFNQWQRRDLNPSLDAADRGHCCD